MRIKAALLALLFALTLASCVKYTPEPRLGIAVDHNLTVISVEPYSPALNAGVQVGDVLVDLTWFSFSNNIRRNDRGINKSPVPFTDSDGIDDLMDFEYLLKLRVKRGGQIVEMTIQPTVPIWRNYPEPTPTPLPPSDKLF